MARLGLRASVQPAHLLDDRDLTELCWPDRAERCFAFRWMVEAGSGWPSARTPRSRRSTPGWRSPRPCTAAPTTRPPWHPEQALTVREALAASVDGQGSVHSGMPADLVLLDADPLAPADDTAEQAARLRAMPIALTLVAGEVVHSQW